MRDLPRHVGPRREAVGALELAALPLQVVGHLVEGVDQPPQFVGGGRRAMRASRSPRAMRRVARISRFTGIGDALGHRVADAGAEHDESTRRQQHAAIELVDLALDLLLPRA